MANGEVASAQGMKLQRYLARKYFMAIILISFGREAAARKWAAAKADGPADPVDVGVASD